MIAIRVLVLLLVMAAGSHGAATAQSGKQVRVAFDFRQSSTQNRDAVDGSGRVIITDRGGARSSGRLGVRSEEHTSELQSLRHLVCRLLLEKKKKNSN